MAPPAAGVLPMAHAPLPLATERKLSQRYATSGPAPSAPESESRRDLPEDVPPGGGGVPGGHHGSSARPQQTPRVIPPPVPRRLREYTRHDGLMPDGSGASYKRGYIDWTQEGRVFQGEDDQRKDR